MASDLIPESAPNPPAGAVALRTLIAPWADLLALDPPMDYLKLAPDVILTLAALAAQGPNGPNLLRSDTAGRLITAGMSPQTDRVVVGWDQFSQTFKVATPQLWVAGQAVMFAGDRYPGDGWPRAYMLTRADPDGTCTVDNDGLHGPAAGALMIAVTPFAPLARPEGLNDTLRAVDVSAQIVAAGTFNVINGVAGTVIRLHRIEVTPQAAALTDFTLESTTGQFLFRLPFNQPASHVFDFEGLQVASGAGVRWRNGGANTGLCYGTLTYRGEYDGHSG